MSYAIEDEFIRAGELFGDIIKEVVEIANRNPR